MSERDQPEASLRSEDHAKSASPQSEPAVGRSGAMPGEIPPKRRRRLILAAKVGLSAVALWLLAAYVILPALWKHYEHQPGLEDAPKTTVTAQGIPGDALNVGLIGVEEDLIHAMLDSGWDPADSVTLRSGVRIARSVLFDKPYADAPVSPLFVFGRKQDLAFEKPVGANASRRHHVRFWKSDDLGRNGVPFWIGAVTFDRGVGLSHTTGQITHHIGPDIDADRDLLMADLKAHGRLTEVFQATGIGATVLGKNGGGDRYFTDGELTVGLLSQRGAEPGETPERLANPVAVQIKEQLWSAIRPLLQSLPSQ